MEKWTHNGLMHDLAEHLRGQDKIVFTDQHAGPAGSQRPDVLAINPSYGGWSPTAFECKVSRADFLSDIKSGKWTGYLKIASAVSFAVPAELVSKAEIPTQAGLIVRHESGWRFAKKPTIQALENYDREMWMALLLSMHGWHRQARIKPRAAEFTQAAKERHALGERIRAFLHDEAGARFKVEQNQVSADGLLERARKAADEIRRKAELENPLVLKAVQGIFAEYGVTYSTGYGIESQLSRMLQGLKERFDADTRIATAQEHLRRAVSAIGISTQS